LALFGANYPNGTLASTRSFADGAEFFSYAELLWSPSRGDRYTKNAHIILWHVDERENAGIPESEGIAVTTNWTFNKTWMPFFRAGWSDGESPLMYKTVTGGFIRLFFGAQSELLGLGFNWGDPSNDDLRDQYTGELFYRRVRAIESPTTAFREIGDPFLFPGTHPRGPQIRRPDRLPESCRPEFSEFSTNGLHSVSWSRIKIP